LLCSLVRFQSRLYCAAGGILVCSYLSMNDIINVSSWWMQQSRKVSISNWLSYWLTYRHFGCDVLLQTFGLKDGKCHIIDRPNIFFLILYIYGSSPSESKILLGAMSMVNYTIVKLQW
jgi:hypothetical protein